ncbi:MAG: 2-succinyl-5-enolpyruvyl-6-hydroxy-3-cyclohexene-1-carboxylic-acid synthase [Gemmatimonadetes bacterium]|nr:2-succinyl-5-enolpyruvyl-6-hydroxy-3-cyclohexene-1-carboxylic-acid synthase [Gemmatimonadota bacterium]
MSGVTGGELNLAWAQAIFSTLAEYGVEEVEIAPGSRSAPLVLAARSLPGMRARVHMDERSAGYFAVGYGRTHLGPAAVVTTSGTAVGNLLPAVIEADQSDLPLILVTADRPPEMRGADANQTILQPGIFGDRVRFEADLPLPSQGELKSTGPRSMTHTVRRAARQALGPPGGPVHLNVPFDKPLQPGSPEGLGLRGPGEEGPRPSETELERVAEAEEAEPGSWRPRPGGRVRGSDRDTLVGRRLEAARRPLLVAGPVCDPGLDGPAVARFAAHRNVPTLADPLSGARFTVGADEAGDAPILGAYDHFLRVPEVVERLAPDLVVRIGRTPTSRALEAALASWGRATQIVIDDGTHRKDHQGLADHYVRAPASRVLDRLARDDGDVGGDDSAAAGLSTARLRWTRRWTEMEAAAWDAVQPSTADADNEGAYAAATVRALPAGATLFVSSSMPVRDVDAYGPPGPHGLQILGNRGASGIDGVVSSALGCAAGGAGPVVALLGDLAFYHDMNGLLAARDRDLNVVFVLVDNDGGGIFHMLPIRDFEPVFTPYFATPHGLDFRHAARMYGLPFTDAASPPELEEAVAAAVGRRGAEVIRVRTDRERNRLSHRRVQAAVARNVNELLDRETQ